MSLSNALFHCGRLDYGEADKLDRRVGFLFLSASTGGLVQTVLCLPQFSLFAIFVYHNL